MKITLEQASDILNRSSDTVLYLAQQEKRFEVYMASDKDMIYNEDGTVSFIDGNRDPCWEFDLQEILEFKKEMDENLSGEIEEILHDD